MSGNLNRKPVTRNGTSQGGFALISAIFLLVVIAGLATFAVTTSTTQNQAQSMDVTGARAYQAALAGVEWAAYNVGQQTSSPLTRWSQCTSATLAAPTLTTVAVGGNLSSFTVKVGCYSTSYVEGGTTQWVYNVTSTASLNSSVPGGVNYVEQVATATLIK